MATNIVIDLMELLAKTPVLVIEKEAGVVVSRRYGTLTEALIEIAEVPTLSQSLATDHRV